MEYTFRLRIYAFHNNEGCIGLQLRWMFSKQTKQDESTKHNKHFE